MNAEEDFFTGSKQTIEKYLQDRLLLLKLQAVEKMSRLSAAMFSGLLIAVVTFFIILFLSIMAAWYFADLLENVYYGFGIISAFYIIVLILLIIFRKRILQRLITNTIINILFEQTTEEDDDTNTPEK